MASSLALFITGVGTGVLAGGASCAVVQGGLLAGAVTRRNAGRGKESAAAPASGPEQEPAPRDFRAKQAQHLAPVAAFLTGKLVSHTAIGALLGVFGIALQPSPRQQAVLMLLAAGLMVLFALDLFGVKAVGRFVPRPPAAFGRVARRSTKTASWFTPGLVGLTTVLLPCGVTLSVELLAITSGSPVGGAAVMAGFVLGTAPLFAVLGYALRRTSRALSGRLGIATGVLVLGVAVWTFGAGLQAGGWASFDDPGTPQAAAAPLPPAPVPVSGATTGPPSGTATPSPTPADGDEEATPPPVTIDASGRQIIVLTVTDGYHPRAFLARAGVPTTLILRGEDSGGCARAFTIPARGIQELVKRNGDTNVNLGTPKPGKLRFSCSMGMQTGEITFQEGNQ